MSDVKGFHLPGTSPGIYVAEAGDGPLVILLHGIGGNSENWIGQLRALSGRFKAVAWDMRGYGASEDYFGPLLIEDLCEDLSAILDYYGVVSAHVIGLSMGGMIAQEFYRRSPERIETLILANTNTGIGVAFCQREKDQFVSLRKEPLFQGREPADILPSMLNALLGESAPQAAIDNISESIRALRKESYIKAVEAIIHFDSSDITEEISVPVMLIGSTRDRVIPVQSLITMNQQIQNSQIYIFEGAGHLTNLERPDEFNALILEFLDKNYAAAPEFSEPHNG